MRTPPTGRVFEWRIMGVSPPRCGLPCMSCCAHEAIRERLACFCRWEHLFRAGDAAAASYALRYDQRRAVTLRDLYSSPLDAVAGCGRGEFDFMGLLLWAAPQQDEGE